MDSLRVLGMALSAQGGAGVWRVRHDTDNRKQERNLTRDAADKRYSR